MRQDPVIAGLSGLLQKYRQTEEWLRRAGLPAVLARLPLSLICLNYCGMLFGKTLRLARIATRIHRWLLTVERVSQSEKARTEMIDLDGGMRDDIEATKRTIESLRDLCLGVAQLFASVGHRSRLLDKVQQMFTGVVDDCCNTATRLQQALAEHDQRALSLLRQMQAEQQAADASKAAHAARAALQTAS